MENNNIDWVEVKKQLKKILKKNAQRRKQQATSHKQQAASDKQQALDIVLYIG